MRLLCCWCLCVFGQAEKEIMVKRYAAAEKHMKTAVFGAMKRSFYDRVQESFKMADMLKFIQAVLEVKAGDDDLANAMAGAKL